MLTRMHVRKYEKWGKCMDSSECPRHQMAHVICGRIKAKDRVEMCGHSTQMYVSPDTCIREATGTLEAVPST